MRMEVFIWPGRMKGAVPMKMMRISSGPMVSVRGNQLAADLRPGVGSMPSKRWPSFHRPMGTPPLRAAWI